VDVAVAAAEPAPAPGAAPAADPAAGKRPLSFAVGPEVKSRKD
jgi:hypothetical protein